MPPEKKPLIILTGPTAAGKTELSLKLAEAVNGEMISADSMQVYRYMNIGTAKIRPEEMRGIRHYLIDVLDPKEEFHVVKFQQMAKQAAEEIYHRGKLPIVVGGTGFYIQALLYDICFEEEGASPYREELQEYCKTYGAKALHEQLLTVDPASYEQIHINNIKRVIRALEFYHENGYPISEHNEEQRQKESPYRFCYFVLTDDRQVLYRRIEKRVDRMLEEGLVDEVRWLLEHGCTKDMVSMQGLGYKEIIAYLEQECTLEEAVNTLKRDTRHFAKRQLTWFRRERDVILIDRSDFSSENEILNTMLKHCKNRGILSRCNSSPSMSVN